MWTMEISQNGTRLKIFAVRSCMGDSAIFFIKQMMIKLFTWLFSQPNKVSPCYQKTATPTLNPLADDESFLPAKPFWISLLTSLIDNRIVSLKIIEIVSKLISSILGKTESGWLFVKFWLDFSLANLYKIKHSHWPIKTILNWPFKTDFNRGLFSSLLTLWRTVTFSLLNFLILIYQVILWNYYVIWRLRNILISLNYNDITGTCHYGGVLKGFMLWWYYVTIVLRKR